LSQEERNIWVKQLTYGIIDKSSIIMVNMIYALDSFIFTMYINGSKIAMASVMSILCYIMTQSFKKIIKPIKYQPDSASNQKKNSIIHNYKQLLSKYQLITEMHCLVIDPNIHNTISHNIE
jgi:hypothetical protein